jgi:putative Mn2+ efflux pump MntP
MDSLITIIIVVALSIQVIPVSLGITLKNKLTKMIMSSIVLIAFQIILLWFGIIAGKSFMYLMKDFIRVIVFIGFLLIGIRMIMEVFTIRKGERTYQISSLSQIILVSIAIGINTFLAGILFYFIEDDTTDILFFMAVATSAFTLLGLILKPDKISLSLASLLNLLAGLTVLISGVYLTFFY